MSVKSSHAESTCRLPPFRLRKRGGRTFRLSLCLSLFCHALIVFPLAVALRPRSHVFILVAAGDEAMAIQVGSDADRSASAPRPPPEISEWRPEPLPQTFAAAKSAAHVDPLPDKTPELAPIAVARPAGFDSPTPERRLPPPRASDEPENFLPAVPAPEIRDMASNIGTMDAEVRFEPVAGRETAFAARSVDSRPETAAPPFAGEHVSEPAELEPRARQLTNDRRRRYHERKDVPGEAKPPPPSPAAATIAGASRLTRGVRQRATAVSSLVPRYPAGSRRRGETGVVTIRALIDAAGRCQWARVESSSGHAALDGAALDAVRRASFRPAADDGVPIAAEERFQIDFRLR